MVFCMSGNMWRMGMLAFLCATACFSADAASLGYDDLILKVDGKRTFSPKSILAANVVGVSKRNLRWAKGLTLMGGGTGLPA